MLQQRRKIHCSFRSFTSLEKLVNSSRSQDVEAKEKESLQLRSCLVRFMGKRDSGSELGGTRSGDRLPWGRAAGSMHMWKYQVALLLYSSIMSRCKGVFIFVDFAPGSDIQGKLGGQSLVKFSYWGLPHCIQEKIGMECFISCIFGLEFILHTGKPARILFPPALPCSLTYVTCALDSLGDIAPWGQGYQLALVFSRHLAQCQTHNSLSIHGHQKQTPRLDFSSGIIKRESYRNDQERKDSTQMLKSSLLTECLGLV